MGGVGPLGHKSWTVPDPRSNILYPIDRGTPRLYNSYMKTKAEKRSEWLSNRGSCVKCGSSENLEIDHIDPRTKSRRIQDVWGLSAKNREAELAKCQILCRTCHIKKSAKEQGHRPWLTDSDVLVIWTLRDDGWGRDRIANHLDRSESQIRDVLSGRTCKEKTLRALEVLQKDIVGLRGFVAKCNTLLVPK